jgi:hypothetical protein
MSSPNVLKNTLGTTRNRTNKFLELRKVMQEENAKDKSYDLGSSLNDNGKTRYIILIKIQ